MTVSIGSSTKLNSIAGISQVLQLTNSEKISLANKILPPNILVRDDAGVLYMSDGVKTVSALEPITALASLDSNGNNIVNTYATKSELGDKADSVDLTNHTSNTNIHVTASDKSNWNAKQDALTIETSLNKNSTNLLTNGTIATALEGKLDATGIAASATKLETSRNINGTAFNGTSAITTTKWGTSRTITVTDNTSTHSTTTSTDGGANFTLTLPGTIDADINGSATTATTASNYATGGTIESALNGKALASDLNTHTGDTVAHCTQAEKNTWNAKQAALSSDQLSAVNSGITSTKVGVYDGYASQIAGKVDASDVNDMISTAISEINTVEMVTAASFAALPASGSVGTFYLVRNTASSGNNLYTEYIWTGTEYEETGANVDLRDYVTNSTLTTELGKKQNSLTTLQQDAVNSGINATKITKYDGYESTINGIISANDSTITIKKNGTSVGSFTTNASTAANIDISVPTKVSDLTNDSGFISAHPTVTTVTDTTSDATPAHGGSFDVVDGVTRDSFGHVTKINVKTITLPADSNTDTLVNQSVSSTNNTYPILLTPTANASSNQGAKAAIFASGVKVNPNTNTLSATAFVGDLTGNVTGNVSGSSGSCTGNAATATNATNNANGKALTDSIIKGLSVSGRTITYTKIDGTTGTITTQDTNTDTKVTQSVNTDNKTFPVLLCNNEDATTDVGAAGTKFASGVKVNPSTNTISATFSGNLTGNVTGNCSGSSGSCTGNAATAGQFSSNASVTLTGDVTGTASSKKGWSIATTLANSGVTQGTYGPSADVTGSNNTTISVPEITVDAKGRITSITNRTYTSVNTDTNTDTKVTQNVSSTNATYPILLTPTANATTNQGAKTAIFASGVKVNPSSGTIAATAFSGPLTGDVTGNCSGTAANVTGTVAIGNGGTGATTRLNAFKNLTNESVGESAQFFITITSGWGKAGYTTITQAKKVLGIDSVANVDASKAITGITRSGTTFTYTCVDGTSGTFDQQDTDTTYSNMTAATASAAGTAGLVPAPGAGKQASFLRGDGTWVVPTNTTYSLMSASEATTGTATTARSISAKVLNDKIDEKISALVASAPEALDTLNELASALGNDPNFATTVATQIGTKANSSEVYHYGVCSTAAATSEKAVSIADFVLKTGATVFVKFTVNNTATNNTLTLNVNNTGAKKIFWRGAQTFGASYIGANRVLGFVYDGTNWEIIGELDTNSDVKTTQTVTTTNATYPILMSDLANATANRTSGVRFGSGVKINPSTNTIYATKFQGALVGNADTATKATNNASGNELSNDIIKGLSVSGKVITYTKLDGSTGTITTQDNDTTYDAMSASEATTGTATTARSITAKVLHDKINAMIPDNVTAITSAEIAELVSQKLSPTPTRDGAMWMDSNYTMFVNEYNRV